MSFGFNQIDDVLVGSYDSLHSSSSIILVEKNNKKVPAIVKDCLLVRVLTQEGVKDFVIAVHWLDEHPHKNWFGSEVQVYG